MGTNFAAPFALLRPVEVDPLKYAEQYQNLANLAQLRQYRQQEMAASQQTMQMRQAEMDKYKYELDQMKGLNQAYQDAFTPDENGVQQFDPDKIVSILGQRGLGSQIPAVKKGILDYQTAKVDYQKAQTELNNANETLASKRTDFLGNVGATLKAHDYDPHFTLAMVQDAVRHGLAEPTQAQEAVETISSLLVKDPSGELAKQWIQPHADQWIAASPAQQDILRKQQELKTGELTQKKTQAELEGKETENKLNAFKLNLLQGVQQNPAAGADAVDQILPASKYPELNGKYKTLYQQAGTGMADPDGIARAKQAVLDAALKKAEQDAPETLKAAADKALAEQTATEPGKIRIAQAEGAARAVGMLQASGLTQDDFARAGEQYARTGVMPPLGRDSVTRAKIVQAANAWAKDQGMSAADVVTMQAAYAGDKKSLENFQKQRDQIVSFEQTAQKNLQQFLDLAGKIPDTGVPWLNMPIRMLDAKLVGNENMAAINAARQVANNEIAKVTSGGGMSGVLSDSARREVSSYNPQNATFAQTKAVARVLQQDMANRHQSMDSTIGDIKSRIGGGGVSTMQPAQSTQSAPQGGTSATPVQPTSIPKGAKVQYNAQTGAWRYSTDQGKTWQTPK